MEGESLLNDGVGVALFVVFSGMVGTKESGGFFPVMLRQIILAVLIGCIVTFLCFQVIRITSDGNRKILASLFMVSCSYLLCEALECSGAISCVVCGVLFSTLREKREEKPGEKVTEQAFDGFWEIIDTLLNSVLYVMMGLSFVRILQMPYVLLLPIAAVLCNFISRFGGLYAATFLIGTIPDGFDRKGFSLLFTWGGLRGGLSIALAMSTAALLPEETYHILLGCVYAIVFFTTVVQGLSMKKVYTGIVRSMTGSET
jgi:CPA1 family monovalent cation:H+ antiporter